MKYAFAAFSTELLLSVSLAAFSLPPLHAEPHCPGNAAVLPFRLLQRFQVVVPVVINHAGPYDFLVDTGTQLTVIDRSLAVELHLKAQGPVEVVGTGFSTNASFTQIHLLETGSQVVVNHVAMMQDLESLHAAGMPIRGILGGNFLGNFDVLMDYRHNILCLDGTKAMRTSVKGMRVDLATPAPVADEISLIGLLLIPVHLSGGGSRSLFLELDSGANVPFLYDSGHQLCPGLLKRAPVKVFGEDGVKRESSALLPQDVRIGSLDLQQISFVVPSSVGMSSRTRQVNGLLPTALFWRVFVSYADHFVVLDPRL